MHHQSWDLLHQLASHSDLSWIVGGNLNEILSNEEKEGGISRVDSLIEMFRMALLDCELTDLGYDGNRYSWSNNREVPNTVRCRLDRACANSAWSALFPESYVEH